MRRFASIFPAIMLIIVCLSGCAGLPRPESPIRDGAFDTRKSASAGYMLPQETAAPPAQPPIVRVIKGTAVENIEDARQRLARQADTAPKGMKEPLHSLILRGVRVREIAELLTEICGYNVVATNTVSEQKITTYLKNLTLREALESICRLNNIWYREGQGVITLMTREEYVRDIEVRQSDQTRAFYIRYTNAADMAKVIQAAMGNDVHLAVIEDEKIYGHIDPEQKTKVSLGTQKKTELTLRPQAGDGSGSLPEIPVPLKTAATPGGAGAAQGSNRPLLAILTVFKRNNCIVARSLDGGLLNEMARIIEVLDTPTSQVLLEIKILQVTLGDGFESFFQFDYADTGSSGFTGNFAAGLGLGGSTDLAVNTLDFIFNSDKLDARIRYFKSQDRAEIVATPFLMAANNSKVEFFVGEETPLRDDVTTTTVAIGDQGDTMTTFQVKIIREELGTDVKMTTFINEDGTVTLEFEAVISTALLNFSSVQVVNEKSGQVIDFPLDATSKNKLKSILTAKSGQSIAIGGIIKETLDQTDNKVPVLGDIPGLGFFFKEIKNNKKKTETVIILTPHVIAHPALAGDVSGDFLGRKSSHELITTGRENLLENRPEIPDGNRNTDAAARPAD